jgi:hypothetical protein
MMVRKKSLHRFIGPIRVTNQDRASMIHQVGQLLAYHAV